MKGYSREFYGQFTMSRRIEQHIPKANLAWLTVSYLHLFSSVRFKRIIGRYRPKVNKRVLDYGADTIKNRHRALIIYITHPFFLKTSDLLSHRHSNAHQAVNIANIFNKLGYIVDVIGHHDFAFSTLHKYDVIFGIHPGFDQIVKKFGENAVKIYYALEMPWQFQNKAIEERTKEAELRKGIRYELRRRPLVKQHSSLALADYVIYMGTNVNLDIYAQYGADISKFFWVPNSTISSLQNVDSLNSKDFNKARKKFLFLSSTGLLLRGLDRLLEVFRDLQEYELYICGPLHGELDFVFAYRRELFKCANIHPVGWIDTHSEVFNKIVQDCAWLIYPSGSEGASGAVINGMAKGLIPIVSQFSGVDPYPFGFKLSDCSIPTIRKLVKQVGEYEPDKCRIMAKAAVDEVIEKYRPENFCEKMYETLQLILRDDRKEMRS